jgi:Zn-finger nucleic acid-binding protein
MGPCPACRSTLAVLEMHGIEVDYCFRCGGSWLDRGEFGLLADGRLDAKLDHYLYGAQPTSRRCPVCLKAMREARFRGTDIVVDACPLKHGFWLDRGELAAIVREGAHRERVGTLADFYTAVFSTQETKPRRSP